MIRLPEYELDAAARSAHNGSVDGAGPGGNGPERVSAFPFRASRFIGRVEAVDRVAAALAEHRLVTVTGTGGCGKTRLAVEVARRVEGSFADGGAFVDLAPVAASLVPNAVAAAVAVAEDGSVTVRELLWRALERRQMLVLVDNCERVVDACATIVDGIIQRCPDVTVLTTSREPLGVDGELTWRVPSLSLPPDDHDEARAALGESEAGALLLDRSALARPDLVWTEDRSRAGVSICRRLDGVPLAIELAASRLRGAEPAEVARGLDDRFATLRTGLRTAPPRQRTLEASIEWSYTLLDERSRRLFERLGVFAATFAMSDAVAVVGTDGLDAAEVPGLVADLVDRSLVQHDGGGHRMLESIRAYAQVRLRGSGEEQRIRLRHLEHFQRKAAAFEDIAEQAELGDAVPGMRASLADIRAALAWSLDNGRIDTGLRLAADLRLFWITDARNQEGRDWLRSLLETGESVDRASHLRGLLAAAQLALFAVDPLRQAELAGAALPIARDLGDREQEVRAMTLLGWSRIFFAPSEARVLLRETVDLAETIGDQVRVEFASFGAGAAAVLEGDLAGAASHLERGAVLSRRRDTFGQMFGLGTLGYVRFLEGSIDDGERLLREACAFNGGDERGFARDLAQQWLALVLTFRGRHDQAATVLEGTLERARSAGNPPMFALVTAAWLAHARGRPDEAAALVGEALPLLELVGLTFWEVQARCLLGHAAATAGDHAGADAHWRRAVESADSSGNPIARTMALVAFSQSVTIDASRRRALLRDAARTAMAAGYRLGAIDAAIELHETSALPDGVATLTADERSGAEVAIVAECERIGYVPLRRRAAPTLPAGPAAPALTFDEALAVLCRGDRRAPRPRTGWASLTPAELRVVRLVADGLTNPQIGTELFLSRRTVKSHLAHAFVKLGVTSRTELAAEYARRSPDE